MLKLTQIAFSNLCKNSRVVLPWKMAEKHLAGLKVGPVDMSGKTTNQMNELSSHGSAVLPEQQLPGNEEMIDLAMIMHHVNTVALLRGQLVAVLTVAIDMTVAMMATGIQEDLLDTVLLVLLHLGSSQQLLLEAIRVTVMVAILGLYRHNPWELPRDSEVFLPHLLVYRPCIRVMEREALRHLRLPLVMAHHLL